jgi:hypothetical protein
MHNDPDSSAYIPKRPVAAEEARSIRTAPAAPISRPDRSALRLAAAERVVADAFADARWGAIDRDTIDAAFMAARDCLAEARELNLQAQAELALARRERYQARRERALELEARSYYRPKTSAGPIVPDAPGAQYCPDPQGATTAQDLMDALRSFWVWAGRPSYRAMARQCGNRYAASTLHGALRSSKLPSLDVLLAIVLGCGGALEHRQAFATAWRQLQMSGSGTGSARPGQPSLSSAAAEPFVLRAVPDTV